MAGDMIRAGMGSNMELSAEEQETLSKLRANAKAAGELVETVTDKIQKTDWSRISASDLGPLLRAATDAQTKSIDSIAKLTGRDQTPKGADMGAVLDSLASRGLLRMTVEIGPEANES